MRRKSSRDVNLANCKKSFLMRGQNQKHSYDFFNYPTRPPLPSDRPVVLGAVLRRNSTLDNLFARSARKRHSSSNSRLHFLPCQISLSFISLFSPLNNRLIHTHSHTGLGEACQSGGSGFNWGPRSCSCRTERERKNGRMSLH